MKIHIPAFEAMAKCNEHLNYGPIDIDLGENVVAVVRCRDCKHWKKGDFQAGDDAMHLEYGGYCPNCRFARYESDFCSYGERMDGDQR